MQQVMMSRPAIGGVFPLVVTRSGAMPRHGMENGKASVRVAILNGQDGHFVVAMSDGNYGVSITNAAEELIGFLYILHLQPLGAALEAVRWIYRDSEGNWDELIPALMHGRTVYGVKYRPLGGRGQEDALAALRAEGVSLSDDDLSCLIESQVLQ